MFIYLFFLVLKIGSELIFLRTEQYFNGFLSLQIKSVQELSGQKCHICGDDVEITVDGELFVACNECAFPVCRPCYEYERREGNQACPQCKTRYKRLKGDDFLFYLFHLSYSSCIFIEFLLDLESFSDW